MFFREVDSRKWKYPVPLIKNAAWVFKNVWGERAISVKQSFKTSKINDNAVANICYSLQAYQ